MLPDGTSIYVIPALDAQPRFAKRPGDCFAREREALEHRLRGKPAAAQHYARRTLRDEQRHEREAARRGPRPGLFVLAFGAHGGGGGGGGGGDVAAIRRRGEFTSADVRGRGARVIGLVPDGVARIDFTFPRHSIDPAGRTDARVYHRSVAVVDNIVAFTVPRRAIAALASRQVWRAADGSVVNVVRGPGVTAG